MGYFYFQVLPQTISAAGGFSSCGGVVYTLRFNKIFIANMKFQPNEKYLHFGNR
jgi:hypothetical protein